LVLAATAAGANAPEVDTAMAPVVEPAHEMLAETATTEPTIWTDAISTETTISTETFAAEPIVTAETIATEAIAPAETIATEPIDPAETIATETTNSTDATAGATQFATSTPPVLVPGSVPLLYAEDVAATVTVAGPALVTMSTSAYRHAPEIQATVRVAAADTVRLLARCEYTRLPMTWTVQVNGVVIASATLRCA
jgi:hypothetical protein